MQKQHYRKTLVTVLLTLFAAVSFAQKGGHTLHLTVNDKNTQESIIMASIQLQPTGAMAVTDMDGKATINNVPTGEYTLQISYVGYEPINTRMKISKDMTMRFQMVPTSLSLREVQVVAKQKESGASTSSVIGRQAIDHLQATSLADSVQLPASSRVLLISSLSFFTCSVVASDINSKRSC